MKSITQFLSTLAILGAIASGAFYYLNSQNKDTIEMELQTVRDQLSSELAKNAQLSEEIDNLSTQIAQSASSLQEARSNITVTAARSNQLKRETQRFSEELEMRIKKEESLQRSLSDLKKEMAEQRATTISLEEAQKFELKIASLESEILDLRNTARKFPSSASSSEVKQAPLDLRGKILTVGPKSSFVITNLGYTNGIRLDHLLAIERAGETIANLQITEVKENLSIGRILPESFKTEPQPGDIVVSGNQ